MTSSLHPDDTIAALASAPGPAARGIVRMSGPRVEEIIAALFVAEAASVGGEISPPGAPQHRAPSRLPRCRRGAIRVAGLSRPVPADLYLWPTRRSYTGQPLAEWHTIGSPPILEAILSSLFAHGARPAQPGEFTLRAFLAGRIDLVQAEAVLGVIDARGPLELRAALEQLGGGISPPILRLRGDLLDLLADLEAGLDFAHENLEFVSHAELLGRLGLARDAVVELLARAESRLRFAERPRVVLAGPPNAGKSTLYNALCGRDAALVSELRGTTRDWLSAEIVCAGTPIVLVDTAGRDTALDPVGQAAQSGGQEQAVAADLVVWCTPTNQPAAPTFSPAPANLLQVTTKIDLEEHGPAETIESPINAGGVHVSARTKAGLDKLADAIACRLGEREGAAPGLLGTTAARSRESLSRAASALSRALDAARCETDEALLAIEVREALDALGEIVGAVYTEDLLDRIFSRFCIGK